MALKKPFTDHVGDNHPNAYFRINELTIRLDEKEVQIHGPVYKDDTYRSKDDPAQDKIYSSFGAVPRDEEYTTHLATASDNLLKAAYAYLKATDEFSAATDA